MASDTPRRPGWRLIARLPIETGTLVLDDCASGAGIHVETWLGDGLYPVYARYAESEYFPGELRIAEVRVIFDGSEAPRDD